METEKVFNRKKELIKRDPLFDELTKTFHKMIDAKGRNKMGITVLEDMKRYFATPYCPDDVRYDHKKKYQNHWNLFQIEGELGYKWHVEIQCNFSSRKISITPYTHDEFIWVGSPPFYEYSTRSASEPYPQLHWSPYPNPSKKEPILADINEFVTPGYKGYGNWIPLLIDVARINKNDAKKVKKHLWEIIVPNLQTKKSKEPHDEYPECAFLYSLRREDTFQKYLKWYDWQIQEKLGWRRIAFIENQSKGNSLKAKELLNKIKNMPKRPQVGVVDPKSNKVTVKGEDKVEKGIKLIYQAIHRKPYRPKDIEPLLDEYNCPEHGLSCPKSCEYHKDWLSRFDRLMPHD